MEALFDPLERRHPYRIGEKSTLTETRLKDGVTLPDLANYRNNDGGPFTWESLFDFMTDKIVWLADTVYITKDLQDIKRGHRYVLGLEELPPSTTSSSSYSSATIHHPKGLYVFGSPRLEIATGADVCEFLVGLLARSETVPRVCFRCVVSWIFSARMLATFLAERQEHGRHVKEVTLDTLYLDEDHCRVLSTAESPDLKIKLSTCVLVASAVEAFCECLQRSKGPTELYECRISAQVIARALRGNTRVTRVIVDQRTPNAPGMAAMADALSENLGLQVLDFYRQPFDDTSWATLCASIRWTLPKQVS
jgi:hypothetical protein